MTDSWWQDDCACPNDCLLTIDSMGDTRLCGHCQRESEAWEKAVQDFTRIVLQGMPTGMWRANRYDTDDEHVLHLRGEKHDIQVDFRVKKD